MPPSEARRAYDNQLAFPLDDFQEEAIQHIDEGASVVVCAPTGAGKTVIAEFAAVKTIYEGGKLFYTTPLKALSNQKYLDLKERFGESRVGLLTGDMSVNRDAKIVVMTTEVFRNMLYGVNEDRTLLNDLRYVVLDECHFMNDASRGTVWEESIIYCPPTVKMIALSATVANADELTRWIDHIHKPTQLVYSNFRPVPLRHFYYGKRQLFPLFESDGRKLNQKVLRFGQARQNHRGGRPGGGPIGGDDLAHMIQTLHHRDMLPAIVFTFSRKGCEKNLKACSNLSLNTPEQKQFIADFIENFKTQTALTLEDYQYEALCNGVGSHHAGLLPGAKLLAEALFQRGLMKVIFATETLAAGINMPARTTVITAISKRCDEGHRLLTASEFLQMSGRAGRRGMDTVGHVVVVASPFDKPETMAKLASSKPDPLNSQFTSTYGMVLNLLQKFSMEEASFLVNKSFGAFTSERRTRPLSNELHDRLGLLDEFNTFSCPIDLSDKQFLDHLNDREKLSSLNKKRVKLKKALKKQEAIPNFTDELHELEDKMESLVLEVEAYPCTNCELFKKHRKIMDRKERLERQIVRLEQQVDEEKNVYWHRFQGLVRLLKARGYLDEANKPTHQGLLASRIRAENELFLAELINNGCFEDLEPPALAAVISTLVNDSSRDSIMSRIRYSKPVKKALDGIYKHLKRVGALQEEYGVDISLQMNDALSPLVEAWALGTPWDGLISSSMVDAGDLVRNIRRTMDLLRQFSVIPEAPSSLALAAREAAYLLNRNPVKEVEFAETETVSLPESILNSNSDTV